MGKIPTITDIAREAGVSHGTVSNVLNRKGNVSSKKIKLVEKVAKKLGYKINYTAKTLRSGKTNTISIILPNIESEQYIQLYMGLDRTLTELGFRTHLYITYDLPYNEKQIIKEIASERVSGAITVSCLDNANSYYQELSISKKNIIFINRYIKNARKFISFDFEHAGKDIQSYLSTNNYKSIGIFSDQSRFSNEREFVDCIVDKLDPAIVKVVHASFNTFYKKAFEFLVDKPLDIIVCSSLQQAKLIREAYLWGSSYKVPKLLCLVPTETTYDEDIIKYNQNYHLLGKRVAILLNNQVNNDKEVDDAIVIKSDGLSRSQYIQNVTEKKDFSISLLTIPSPTTDALKRLTAHFKKMTGISVKLYIKDYDEIFNILSKSQHLDCYDLIRIDMAWLNWFGKEVFCPLDKLDKDLKKIIDRYPDHIKKNYSEIRDSSYAMPFDPSIQMLFYRKDLFEDHMIKRMYFEKNKKQLTLPATYDDYNKIMDFFLHSEGIYGASAILGKPEIIASEFLTRYYAEGGMLINNNQIKLDIESSTKALSNFIEMVDRSKKVKENWWNKAVNNFSRGETAMFLGFMNHISQIAYSDIGSLVGYTQVPGGNPLLGGGVIGINKHSAYKEEAATFLKWINQTEVAEQLTLLGGVPANFKVLENQSISTLFPWLEEAKNSISSGIRETTDEYGTGLNMREIEEVIGQEIGDLLNRKTDINTTINKINTRIKKVKSR